MKRTETSRRERSICRGVLPPLTPAPRSAPTRVGSPERPRRPLAVIAAAAMVLAACGSDDAAPEASNTTGRGDAVAVVGTDRLRFDPNGAYGYKFELFPAHEAGYKYVDRGNGMVSIELEGAVEVGDSPHTVSEAELRQLVESHLGEKAGPEPKPGFFPSDVHPDVQGGSPPTEQDEPEHTHGEGG